MHLTFFNLQTSDISIVSSTTSTIGFLRIQGFSTRNGQEEVIKTEGKLMNSYLCPHKYQIHSTLVVRDTDTGVPLSGTNTLPAIAAWDTTVLTGDLVVYDN
jgi:hypothetical protein